KRRLVMGQRQAGRIIQPPGAAPAGLAQSRATSPEIRGCIVEETDPAVLIGRIDRYRQRLQHRAELAVVMGQAAGHPGAESIGKTGYTVVVGSVISGGSIALLEDERFGVT